MQDTKERKENQEVLVRRGRRCAGSRKHLSDARLQAFLMKKDDTKALEQELLRIL